MRLVIHPPVEAERLAKIVAAAGPMEVVNAADAAAALAAMPTADAFFGKMTPELLAAAGRLRWVQSPTASLEHYLFPALVEHSCELTNMRGLYSDVIAEHVLGMMLSFTRHLHTYARNQVARRWEPVGGEAARPTFITGPGVLSAMDVAHRSLGDLTLGIVALGSIGSEIARAGVYFGMRVLAVDPVVRERRQAWRACGRWSGSTTCWPPATSWSSPRRTRPRPSSSFAGPGSA